MAKIIKREKIIKNNIENYLKQSTDNYGRLLEGSPAFVTYYRKDAIKSTEDTGMESVLEVVGEESPIKYVKIDEFPLYSLESSDLSTELGDFGLDTDYQSTAVILPNTIVPLPEDYFTFFYNGIYLFKVIKVDPDRFEGKKFYKVTFEASESSHEFLEKQVESNYETIYDNIGTEDRVIVESTKNRHIKVIDELVEGLIDFYDKNYRNKKFDMICYRHNSYYLYNSFLLKFIKDNEIFTRKYTYMKSIYINDFSRNIPRFDEVYKRTIYYALEKNDFSHFEWEDFLVTPIDEPSSPFYRHYETFYDCKYFKGVIPTLMLIRPHNSKLIDKVTNKEYYYNGEPKLSFDEMLMTDITDDPLITDKATYAYQEYLNSQFNNIDKDNLDPQYVLENIIIKYLSNELKFNEELLNEINEIDYTPYLSSFLLVPCIIFILKNFKKQLLL